MSSPVPDAIRKQSEAIDKFYQGELELDQQVTIVDADTPNDGGDLIDITAPTQVEADETIEVAQEPSQQAGFESEGVQQPNEQLPESVSELAALEQKYKSLQGMYNADVPRLNEQLKELKAQVAAKNVEAQSRKELNLSSEDDEGSDTYTTSLSDTEYDDYGEEMLDVVGRHAMDLVPHSQAFKKLADRVVKLEAKLAATQYVEDQNKEGNFYGDLTSQVSNWRDINQDPDFLTWLSMNDPYSGELRKDLVMKAFEAKDSTRVARFFKGFIGEHSVAGVDKSLYQARENSESQIDLESLIEPSGNAGQPTSQMQAPPTKTWNQKEIAKFYSDVTRGKYKHRPDERDKIEKQIFEAQRMGKIA